MKKVLLIIPALLVLMLVWAAPAQASEPYSLEQDGLHMVSPLKDNDHLNVRRDDGETVNIHIEAKCADRTDAECAGKPGLDARWLGETFVPWSAFGVTADSCAVWVQHLGANWHYGEHGEPAYCPDEPSPKPEPSPEPEPSVTPEPEPSVTPTPEVPETETPEPETTPEPDDEGATESGASSTPPRYVDTPADESPAPLAVDTPILAETGPALAAPLIVAAVLAVLGVGAVAMSRRWKA